MRIIFWQNIPSFHQSATIRALASINGCDITLVLQDELPQSFRDDGWGVPDFGNTKLRYPQNDYDISSIFSEAGADAVHIFSGIRYPMVRKAFIAAIRTQAHIGLLVETIDWKGLRGFARLLLYRFELLRFKNRIDFILAMGQLGVNCFTRCGFPADKIYPFAYVVEKQSSEPVPVPADDTVHLIYVGRCIKLKGLDVLISALTGLSNLSWRLDIVGNGSELDNLKRQAAKSDLIDKISFHGALPNEAARKMIAAADFLILPSRSKEGWGAVINESLMHGVPVICSDTCGAADLLNSPERGEVFKAGSVPELSYMLKRWINKGKRTGESTGRIKLWSKFIEGETVAHYLLDVITAATSKSRPHVPWRN